LTDTNELGLLHTPPGVALLNVIDDSRHTPAGPVIADGEILIVTSFVAMQPVPNVYVIVTTPEVTPVTWPTVFTVAIAVLLLLHVPPPASVKVIGLPIHAVDGPEMAEGRGLTVIGIVRVQPVGNV